MLHLPGTFPAARRPQLPIRRVRFIGTAGYESYTISFCRAHRNALDWFLSICLQTALVATVVRRVRVRREPLDVRRGLFLPEAVSCFGADQCRPYCR